MKNSRRVRKAINEAKRSGYIEGYAEGYAKGLHDGNPFLILAEYRGKVLASISENLNDPKFVEMCMEAKRLEEENKEVKHELYQQI